MYPSVFIVFKLVAIILLFVVVVTYAPYWILDDSAIELFQQKGFLK